MSASEPFFVGPQAFSGVSLFVMGIAVLQCLRGGFLYLRSDGIDDRVYRAKNVMARSFGSFLFIGSITVVQWVIYAPTLAQIFKGMAFSAGTTAIAGLFLSFWSVMPPAVAAYSAWWMPKAERTAHRQDIRCALRWAAWSRRSSHAWGVVKSSPRVGLQARRHHKRLAAAMTGSPARMQVSD